MPSVTHASRPSSFTPRTIVEHALERRAVLHLAPRRAHAEARRAVLLRAPARRASTSSTSSIFSAPTLGLVVARLRAVRAVLGAAAGLHAEQRAELHLVVGVVRAVDGARLVEEREERAVVRARGRNRASAWGRRCGASCGATLAETAQQRSDPEASASGIVAGARGDCSMPTVLLVDDSAVVRRVLARRLDAEGFEVREAVREATARKADLPRSAARSSTSSSPDGDGTDLARSCSRGGPRCRSRSSPMGTAPSLVEGARLAGPGVPQARRRSR